MTIRSRDRIRAEKNRRNAIRLRYTATGANYDGRNHDPKPQRSVEQLRESRARFLAENN
mgnify:CR=1 FL=1